MPLTSGGPDGQTRSTAPRWLLPRFLALYGALFLAFGVSSPFLAVFLESRHLSSEAIGLVLGAATAVRLVAGPLFGSLADRHNAPRRVLLACSGAATVAAFCYLPATGLVPLLLVAVLHSAMLAPTTAIADAMTLAAGKRVEYGSVRGVGSAAFIAGTLLAGRAVAAFGLDAIIWLNGMLLGLATGAAARLPNRVEPMASGTASKPTARVGAIFRLFRQPLFGRLLVVAGLIQGSHAFHDSFVAIHWRGVGISPGTIGVLWSESVAAEVLVFLMLGPAILKRIGPAGASMLAAAGGILRWGVLAETTSVAASALVEPLHGLTFALQHLACMRLIAVTIPRELAVTAQTVYGTLAVGASSAALTFGSGVLYAHVGAAGFWVMAGACAAALPLAAGLRQPA